MGADEDQGEAQGSGDGTTRVNVEEVFKALTLMGSGKGRTRVIAVNYTVIDLALLSRLRRRCCVTRKEASTKTFYRYARDRVLTVVRPFRRVCHH